MADFTALKTAIQNTIKQNGNEEITGNLLQDVLLAIVTTLGEGNINNLINSLDAEVTARQQAVSAEAQARQLADSTLQGGINTVSAAITAINNAIGNGCVYAGIATPSSTPASGRVFYLALTAGTYTNFGNLVVTQGINILKNNGSTWSLDSFLGIDDAPTPSSNKLVKSGGIFNDIMTNGSAFDLTAYNNGTTYADLNAALTALNALPAAYKKGGMSVKYVQTYDNKYVKFFCTADEFTTDVTKWQKEDNNLIYQALISSEYKEGGAYSISAGNVRWSENANWYGFVVKDLKTGDIVEVRGVGGASYRLWYACNGTGIQRNADASVNAMEPIRITIQEGENTLYGSLSASYIADSYVKVITTGDNLNKRVSGIETSLILDEDNISVLKQLLYADNKQKISLVSGTNKQGVDFPANTFVASKPVVLFVLDPLKILSQYSVVTGKGETIERNVSSYEPNKVYIIDNLNPTALSNALHFYTYGSYISESGDVLFFITQDIRNVFAYLYELKKMFDADSIPTYGSEKFAKSGGIYNAITEKLLSAIENSLNGGYINDQGNAAFSEGSNWKSFYLTDLNVGDIVEIKGIGGASYRLWYACKTKNEVMPKIKRQADASLDASTPIRITIEGQEDSIYVSMNVASYTAGGYVKVITTSNYLNKKINNIEQVFATKRLVCIGDSITQGAGASDHANTYYWKLLTALKSAGVVTEGNNLGSGGAKSSNISAYCGANKLIITSDVTIPATGSVTIGLNINVFDAGGGVTYCNPCTLGGIKGELSYANNTYTFTRAEDGDATFVCAGTALLTQANLYALSSEVLVCFAGANDNIDTYPDKEEALLANIDNIVRLSRNGKFVVIIPYVGSTLTDFRDKVLSKYGSRCLDMYTYMSNMSVIDAVAQGLLPSGEQSNWASLLLTDGVHPNDIGHTLLAQQIYKRITELEF